MKRYNPSEIEPKWQEKWESSGAYTVEDSSEKPKTYVAEMFPYPSGAGLHVGHVRNFTIVDVIGRFNRQLGRNVLRPIGWDTFGLPAENYAIKTGISPQSATKTNITNFKNQYKRLGMAVDWSREINTSHPEYYRWTQWVFAKLFGHYFCLDEKKALPISSLENVFAKTGNVGMHLACSREMEFTAVEWNAMTPTGKSEILDNYRLAYRQESFQWWCPSCKTVLANEQVESGRCWRCDSEVHKKKMKQWFFRITAYADELLDEIDELDWPEKIKAMQRNWIGRSEGAEIEFDVAERLHFFAEDNPPRPDKEFTRRKFVAVFVRDPKTDKYLAVKWQKFPWVSVVGGGVGEDEDVVGAARREVLEEAGYKNLKFERILGEYESEFYAANKGVNRVTDSTAVLFELIDDERVEMSQEESETQLPVWLKRDEFKREDMPAFAETMQGFEWIDGHEDEPCGKKIKVFTTRPDTIFGATFMVLAPEHELVSQLVNNETQEAVGRYCEEAMRKSEIERQENKDKTGVFTGSYALNPMTGNKMPIWVADYVLAGYGEGAIMAVPAHDERDFEFAQKFGLSIEQVVMPSGVDRKNPPKSGFEMIERPTVFAHLRDRSTGLYALLKWRGTLDGVVTAIMGGIESDETAEQAGIREIAEESGLSNVRLIKKSPWHTAAEYCASHKGENRKSISEFMLFEVDSIDEQKSVGDDEVKNHTVIWVKEEEVYNTLTPDDQKLCWELLHEDGVFSDSGEMINSGEFNGMTSDSAGKLIIDKLEERKIGRKRTTYRMRDWLISRQRYWGAPIPVVYDENDVSHVVDDSQLPVILPEISDYHPDDSGRSALAKNDEFLRVTIDGEKVERETDTMDGYACSSWYLLRYCDPRNSEIAWSSEKVNYWNPLDFYVGGDHAVAHLLYVRFWTKFFADLKLVNFREPVKRLLYNGYINAPDGKKMSKSKGNVIDPLELIDQGYGADALRVYEMFIGPYDLDAAWDPRGIGGVYRFLNRVWTITQEYLADEKTAVVKCDADIKKSQHSAIKKVTEDLSRNSFNTPIACLMEYVNDLYKFKTGGFDDSVWQEALESLVTLLAPFAPHVAAELFEQLGHKESIEEAGWPEWDEKQLVTDEVEVVIQVNGKLRGKMSVGVAELEDEEGLKKKALEQENVVKFIDGKEVVKVIFVKKNHLVNVVVK
jgi:Leucyl-tRNA synthetase